MRDDAYAAQKTKFQSTLSVRRATQPQWEACPPPAISIHALRKESDPIYREDHRAELFQSTLSVRRATVRSADIH